MFEFVILNLKTKDKFCFVFTLNALKVKEVRKKYYYGSTLKCPVEIFNVNKLKIGNGKNANFVKIYKNSSTILI
jgi:hypothetical protein